MPATQFICPNGKTINIATCLKHCSSTTRCMFLPTLRAIAVSLERGISEPTVTELLSGTRETYLKKTTNFAIAPMNQLYALHGSAFHTINEGHTEGNMLSEERIYDATTSGKFDLYGQILDEADGTLGDFKVSSSYKLMLALGIYKIDVPTGSIYKTGARKGQEKTRKEFRYDGVKHLLDWAIQINYYRILLESQGLQVGKMVIQAMCRDYNLRTANERGITEPIKLIPINKISDIWVKKYMETKAKRLKDAMNSSTLPPMCTAKERWNDRKCMDYCTVASSCPHAQWLLQEKTLSTTA